ncbi:hypothetical protein F4604DRAFT_1751739 [Suillus subluteus]|nr:hypothetical protein F4604DRAFT_1751739 [Suillus subluteus]
MYSAVTVLSNLIFVFAFVTPIQERIRHSVQVLPLQSSSRFRKEHKSTSCLAVHIDQASLRPAGDKYGNPDILGCSSVTTHSPNVRH